MDNNYTEMNKACEFLKGNGYSIGMRALFDRSSSESQALSEEDKLLVLKALVESGISLSSLLKEYQHYYRDRNRDDIADMAILGVTYLLEASLRSEV